MKACSRLALSHRVLLVLSHGDDVRRVVDEGAEKLRCEIKDNKGKNEID